MSLSTFEFNGITKPYLVLERGWSLPGWAPIERSYENIPGRAGGVQMEMRTGIRRFSLPIIIRSQNAIEKKRFIEDMSAWLIHEDEKPLVFSKHPNRTLFARVEGTPDFEQLFKFGQGVINFSCADPYEYGEPNINVFENGKVNAYNGGTVESPPVYEIDVLEDITHLDIVSDFAYTRLGQPAPVDNPGYESMRLILNDTLKTLLPWSDAQSVDNGYVAGIMLATQAGFRATNYGAPVLPHKFQGPAKRRSLPEPVQDFRIDVPIDFLNYDKETGMIEVYLLDAFSNTVAKIGFEDLWPTLKKAQSKFQLGDTVGARIENIFTPTNYNQWNDFKGIMRLQRRGNVFTPYFAVIKPDGQHAVRYNSYSYTDERGDYSAPITQVQVALRKWPGSSTSQADMTIKGLTVWEYNNEPAGIPFIAKTGDKIIIDVKEGVVLLNGEVQEDLADWFGDFFDLPPGETTLVMQPADKVNAKVIVRERFR